MKFKPNHLHNRVIEQAKRSGVMRALTTDGWTYSTPEGLGLPRKHTEDLIRAGLLVGQDDGLFQNDDQMFRFKIGEAP